jgi:hypothetical protein
MTGWLRSIAATIQRWWRLLVLFLILRLGVGVALLAFDADFARGIELTVIVAASLAVYLLVALAVRRWAPPRRSS